MAGVWVQRVKAAERRGEYLAAIDLAQRGLERLTGTGRSKSADAAALKYLLVRCLVRSGAADQAAAAFRRFGLDRRRDIDTASLWGRILKDRGLAASGTSRDRLLREAAGAYRGVFRETGSYYPAINAATLYLLAGERARAETLARDALRALEGAVADSRAERYYQAATEAEAALILGDPAAAGRHLEAAARRNRRDYAALATTRRQLRLICDDRGVDPAILDPIRPPTVIHYVGHMIAAPGAAGRFPAGMEGAVRRDIDAYFDGARVGFAYGSLACGADILFAEAALARRVELQVVLPFRVDDFIATSVATGGRKWVRRFESCLAAARAVHYATEDAFLGDESLFSYGTYLTMGLAFLRARNLETDLRQVAVWDGRRSANKAGTAHDVALWRRLGLPSDVISVPADAGRPAAGPPRRKRTPARRPCAMLFGDVKGFSSLSEEVLPDFHRQFMGRLARVLARYDPRVLYRNSWGDAIYVVLDDAVAAAHCALDLQRAIQRTDFAAYGLPADLSLRLGGHFGPVFDGRDYIRRESTFFGSHVTRAARIEPITPPGEVYVTEAMAAALALARQDEIDCTYVGHVPTAKNYGAMRMYVLKRRVA